MPRADMMMEILHFAFCNVQGAKEVTRLLQRIFIDETVGVVLGFGILAAVTMNSMWRSVSSQMLRGKNYYHFQGRRLSQQLMSQKHKQNVLPKRR
jgi:hypothetical protein